MADLTTNQAFDATCIGPLSNTGGGNFPGSISYNPASAAISYTLPGLGSRSFTAADRYVNTSDSSDYRQQGNSRFDYVSIRSSFNTVRPQYVRGVTIDYEPVPITLGDRGISVRCVIGMPTVIDDLPKTAVTFSTIGVAGLATSGPSVTSLTSASGSLSVNLAAQMIQGDLTLFAAGPNGTTLTYGPIRFSTNYEGTGGTFAGVIPLDNGASLAAAGSLFGPAGREVGVAFGLVQVSGGVTTSIQGQLIATR